MAKRNSFRNESLIYLLDRVGCDGLYLLQNKTLKELPELDGKAGIVAWFLYGQYKKWEREASIKRLPSALLEYANNNDLCLEDWQNDAASTLLRSERNLEAISLGLNYAIFQGGLALDSSMFCQERNNLIYSRVEISKWDRDFQMPYKYDPFVDLGGFNCRHTLDWISDGMATVMFEENLTAKIERYKELKMI